jgi:hypothetical protein
VTDLRSQLQSTLGSAYTIDRELGGGGMSRVFLAEETALGRKVVVKVLPPDVTAGVNVERFRREIQVSAKLQHPHIVPVLSSGEMDGVPYYTMPFVEGESLRARIASQGPLGITDALNVLRDVSRALAYAHERGVAHRDIKPDNILLSGGSATVADFGIAKAISAAKGDAANPTLTSVGTSLGTPAYMAPEQAAADPATNHRADIYAFGCVGYELLTGRPPFVAKSPQRLLAAQMSDKPQPVAELRADIPPVLADLVMRCLEKDADARPQSALDLARVLDTVTSGGGHDATPAILMGGPATFRRAVAVYVAAFIAVAVLAKAAVIGTGLPDWVFPGAIIVMALGLPVLLLTAYAQRVAHRTYTMTPAYTPGGSPSMPHGTMATMALRASPHLSWNRATMGGVYALGAFVFLVGGFMALRSLGIGPAGSLFAAGKLVERERLIVTEFHSPDTSLSTLVTEAVRTNLGQSRVLSIMPPVAVSAALQRMQRPTSSRVDFALAREIAQREGVKAIVDGSIRPLAGGYVVSLRLVGVDSSNELAVFQQTASTPGELLQSIDDLTRKLRGKAGESLRDVRGSPPLEQVTTASLPALRVYAEGARMMETGGGWVEPAERFREAVRLDAQFGMAWRKLGVALANGGAPRALSDSAFERAYALRERMTERERWLTEGSYYQQGPGRNRIRSAAAYERVLQIDPNDMAAANNLAVNLGLRRETTRSESLYKALIADGRGIATNYTNLVLMLLNNGKLAEADSLGAVVRERYPRANVGHLGLMTVLYVRGQYDSMEAVARRLANNPDNGLKAGGLHQLEMYSHLRGRMREGMQYKFMEHRARRAQGREFAPPLVDTLDFAEIDLLYGDTAGAIRRVDAARRNINLRAEPITRRPYPRLIAFYARAGSPQRARAVLAEADAEPLDSVLRRQFEPLRARSQGMVALAEGRYADAVRDFWRSDSAYDGPSEECGYCVYANVGEAWDRAGAPDSAIAYFTRYLDAPSAYRLDSDGWDRPYMVKRLGELYEAKGDTTNAAKRYREFVMLWEKAEPRLQPQVAEVRRRLSRLADAETRARR